VILISKCIFLVEEHLNQEWFKLESTTSSIKTIVYWISKFWTIIIYFIHQIITHLLIIQLQSHQELVKSSHKCLNINKSLITKAFKWFLCLKSKEFFRTNLIISSSYLHNNLNHQAAVELIYLIRKKGIQEFKDLIN
jgi:uncharacterized protein YbbC (DUF1343 family)